MDQLNEQLSMFMEMVAAKDQIVMALTIKVNIVLKLHDTNCLLNISY